MPTYALEYLINNEWETKEYTNVRRAISILQNSTENNVRLRMGVPDFYIYFYPDGHYEVD